MSYHLEYVDKAERFDEIVEQDGVKVVVDSKALFSIIGSEMDWQEDALQAKFVFKSEFGSSRLFSSLAPLLIPNPPSARPQHQGRLRLRRVVHRIDELAHLFNTVLKLSPFHHWLSGTERRRETQLFDRCPVPSVSRRSQT